MDYNPGSYIVTTLKRKGFNIDFPDIQVTIKFNGGHSYDGGVIEVFCVPSLHLFHEKFSWYKEMPDVLCKITDKIINHLDSTGVAHVLR
jgi:hypothetical protein